MDRRWIRVVTRPSDPSPRAPGRPRSARADRAILEAALQSFIDHGYAGMSMEGVAASAGVAKTTIYRRWLSKEELLLAAIESLFEDLRVPDTGDVRADLIFIARQAHRFLTETKAGEVFPRMVVEVTSGTPLGRRYLEKVIGPRLRAFFHVLQAAKRRGELRADLDEQLAVATIIGSMIFLRISLALPGASEDLAERLVRQLVEGMEA